MKFTKTKFEINFDILNLVAYSIHNGFYMYCCIKGKMEITIKKIKKS